MTDSTEHAVEWFDESGDQDPLEPSSSEEQVDALLELLGDAPRRVLDLGCGAGRVLVPLAEAGHEMTGLDRDAAVLARCRAALDDGAPGTEVRLVEASFEGPWPDDLAGFDAVTCVGNTLMMLADVDDAVELLRLAAGVLRSGGMFIMDDCPGAWWPELTEGNWVSGVSEEPPAQLVWEEDDAVFALREGDRVDTESWRPGPGDRRLRLWTTGALRLAGRLAGLSAPERRAGRGLLVMRAGSDSNAGAL